MTMDTHAGVDYLIVGAGPAGLQLAYYLDRAGRSYKILEEAEQAGHFFKDYPRHRKLLSINKVYTGYDDPEINLRWDWNSLLSDEAEPLVKDYSKRYFPHADDLLRYLQDFAREHDLPIHYGVRVERISRDDEGAFRVEASDGVHSARRLIVATGLTRPYVPDIPGIEVAEGYEDMSVDPQDFCNQRVLILGKGNSAFETADNLVDTAALIHLASPHSVELAWQTHFVGHIRAVNNNILDTYQLKSQNAILDAEVVSIEKQDDGTFLVQVRYAHADGEVEELVYDRILRCTGFRFDPSLFAEDLQPELTIKDRFPRQTDEWESTNIPDLYFGGTLMQARDYRKTTSAFIHGFRYNMRSLFHILEEKYHDRPWPERTFVATPDSLTDEVLKRVNRSSALWQQFGYLADMIHVDPDGKAHYREEVPVDRVRDGDMGDHDDYYLVTLEYGPDHRSSNPFAVKRIARHDTDQAERSNFLHPVVRHYKKGELASEHHVIEDLAAEWWEPEHTEPLHAYFSETVAGVESTAGSMTA